MFLPFTSQTLIIVQVTALCLRSSVKLLPRVRIRNCFRGTSVPLGSIPKAVLQLKQMRNQVRHRERERKKAPLHRLLSLAFSSHPLHSSLSSFPGLLTNFPFHFSLSLLSPLPPPFFPLPLLPLPLFLSLSSPYSPSLSPTLLPPLPFSPSFSKSSSCFSSSSSQSLDFSS